MKQLFSFALLVLASTGFSQTANNKISFQSGQKLEIVTETKKTSSLELMGQKMESVLNSTMTESYDIQKTDAQGTNIEYKVKRLVVNLSGGMGGDQSFDSEKEGDRKGELGKLLEKSLKNKYTMTVDSYGNITAVKADDDNPNNKKDENDAMAQMISSQMGITLGLPKVGSASPFKFLPAKDVAINDSWTDTASANGQKRTTVYKVNSINDDNILLDYKETIETNTTQEMMGVQASVKNNDTTTGQVTLDRKTGVLKKKTYVMDSKGTLEGQGMTIPSTAQTTITITVKS